MATKEEKKVIRAGLVDFEKLLVHGELLYF